MWREYYKLPLKMDSECPVIIWTADKQRAFDWCSGVYPYQQHQQDLLDIINSDSTIREPFINYPFYKSGDYIYSGHPVFKGSPVIQIRGWGHLVVTDGCEIAAEIRDTFGEYIVNQLNKYVKIIKE